MFNKIKNKNGANGQRLVLNISFRVICSDTAIENVNI